MNSLSLQSQFGPASALGLASVFGLVADRSQNVAPRALTIAASTRSRGEILAAALELAPKNSAYAGGGAANGLETLPRREPSGPSAPKHRVLFMDDDEHIRVLTGGMLESLGYPCDLARNGGDAIRLYQQSIDAGHPYDVVIMDLNIIGGMGGEEVFSVLRRLDPKVRAIVASGYDNEDRALHLMEKGFRGYLTKPYRIVELDAMIRATLE